MTDEEFEAYKRGLRPSRKFRAFEVASVIAIVLVLGTMGVALEVAFTRAVCADLVEENR